MIDEVIVRKCFEECDRLGLVIRASLGWVRLTGPSYNGVRGVPLFKRVPVLRVPRVIECPHQFDIIHVVLHFLGGSVLSEWPGSLNIDGDSHIPRYSHAPRFVGELGRQPIVCTRQTTGGMKTNSRVTVRIYRNTTHRSF